MIPGIGQFAVGESDSVDAGYLRQGQSHGSQKDVEHLDISASLVNGSFAKMTFRTHPTLQPYPVVYDLPTMIVPVDYSGSPYDQPVHCLVPWGSHGGMNGNFHGRRAYSIPAVEDVWWRMFVCWLTPHILVCGWVNTLSTQGSSPCTVSYTVRHFSDDFSRHGSVNGSKNFTNIPFGADWTVWFGAVEADALAKGMAITTFSNSISDFPTTTKEPTRGIAPPDVSNLERGTLFKEDLNPVWGDIVSDCYSQVQLWSGNMLSYARDLTVVVKSAKELLSIGESLVGSKDLSKVAKSLADLFLSFKYGWYLSAKDTISLVQVDYDRQYPNGRCKRSSSYTYIRNGVPVIARCAVYCRPYSNYVHKLAGFCKALDMDFTLENLWDLVPYSFVVDWFLGIGSVLKRLDQISQLDDYDIFLTGKSLKTAIVAGSDKILSSRSWFGPVTAKFYKRVYQTTPITPTLVSYRQPNQKFDHWLESTALVVQRL